MAAVAMQSAPVTVYRLSDGEPVDRWPVDAKELVASGEFAWAPPVLDVREHGQHDNAEDEHPAVPAGNTPARRRR